MPEKPVTEYAAAVGILLFLGGFASFVTGVSRDSRLVFASFALAGAAFVLFSWRLSRIPRVQRLPLIFATAAVLLLLGCLTEACASALNGSLDSGIQNGWRQAALPAKLGFAAATPAWVIFWLAVYCVQSWEVAVGASCLCLLLTLVLAAVAVYYVTRAVCRRATRFVCPAPVRQP